MALKEADYLLALNCVRGVGGVRARALLDYFGSGEAVFNSSFRYLKRVNGIPENVAKAVVHTDAEKLTWQVRKDCERLGIKMLAISDDSFPARLAHCHDSPLILFYKGTADLNAKRILSVVGTRRMTHYGRRVTEELIDGLSAWSPLIVSGLAYGIDFTSHQRALRNSLSTVAVLPGGIDRLYPADHSMLAKQMTTRGGLLSEMPPGTTPEKEYFPSRNRIIAGISDATLVVESGTSGGSMITCYTTHGYEREVLAVPGRITDKMSGGPNKLIRDQIAYPVTCSKDIADFLAWGVPEVKQQSLFVELSEEENVLLKYCAGKNDVSVDEIMVGLSSTHSKIASLLLSLEFKGLIRSLPGNRVSFTQHINAQYE